MAQPKPPVRPAQPTVRAPIKVSARVTHAPPPKAGPPKPEPAKPDEEPKLPEFPQEPAEKPDEVELPECPEPEPETPEKPHADRSAVNQLVGRITRDLAATLLANFCDSLAAVFALEPSAVGDLLRKAADEFTTY